MLSHKKCDIVNPDQFSEASIKLFLKKNNHRLFVWQNYRAFLALDIVMDIF